MSSPRHKTKYPGVYYRETHRVGGRPGDMEKTYYVTWKEDGKKVEAKCGREYRDGMTPARAARIRAEFIEGKRLTRAEKRREDAANPTLAALWERYSATLTNDRTRKAFATDFLRMPDDLKKKRPNEISIQDIEDYNRQLIQRNLAPQTRKHSLAIIRQIISWGARQQICEPLKFAIPMPKVDNKKTEFLDDEQHARLLKALDSDPDQNSANCVRFVILTGIRRSALFALEWNDIDFERGLITLRGEVAKNGKTSIIPMSEKVRELLARVPRRSDCPYVFPDDNGKRRYELPRKTFQRRIREAAELPEGFRFLHGLRHSFASRLASTGKIDMYTLQKLLTHESPAMTQRYSHLLNSALRRAANIIDEVMEID